MTETTKTESTAEKHAGSKKRARDRGPLGPALAKLRTALADHETMPRERYDRLTLNQEEIEALKIVTEWAQRSYDGRLKGGSATSESKAEAARQNSVIPKKSWKRKPGPRGPRKNQPTS